MARLYMKASSDERGEVITKTGNTVLTVNVFWGSTHESKRAGEIHVEWPKGQDKPRVSFTIGRNVLDGGLEPFLQD